MRPTPPPDPESETDHAPYPPNNRRNSRTCRICESLLLALNDSKILPRRRIVGISLLGRRSAAHDAAPDLDQAEMHRAVSALINGILAGGNSVRRR